MSPVQPEPVQPERHVDGELPPGGGQRRADDLEAGVDQAGVQHVPVLTVRVLDGAHPAQSFAVPPPDPALPAEPGIEFEPVPPTAVVEPVDVVRVGGAPLLDDGGRLVWRTALVVSRAQGGGGVGRPGRVVGAAADQLDRRPVVGGGPDDHLHHSGLTVGQQHRLWEDHVRDRGRGALAVGGSGQHRQVVGTGHHDLVVDAVLGEQRMGCRGQRGLEDGAGERGRGEVPSQQRMRAALGGRVRVLPRSDGCPVTLALEGVGGQVD